eukprot:5917436-Amphidinium_carterae.1
MAPSHHSRVKNGQVIMERTSTRPPTSRCVLDPRSDHEKDLTRSGRKSLNRSSTTRIHLLTM